MPNNIFYDPVTSGMTQGMQVGMMLRRMQDEETQNQQQQQNYQQQQEQEGNLRDAHTALALFNSGARYATPGEIAQRTIAPAVQTAPVNPNVTGTDLSDAGDESSGAGTSAAPSMPQTQDLASRMLDYTDSRGGKHTFIFPSQDELQQQAASKAQAVRAAQEMAENAGHARNLRDNGFTPDPVMAKRLGLTNLPGGKIAPEALPSYVTSVANLLKSDAGNQPDDPDAMRQVFNPIVDNQGNAHMVSVSNSGKPTVTNLGRIGKAAASAADDDTPGSQFTPAQRATAQARHDKLQLQEQQQHDIATQYGNALTQADEYIQQAPGTEPKPNPAYTGNVLNPKTGKTLPYNDLVKASYQNTITQAQKKAAILAEQQRQLRQTYGFGEFAPGAGTPAASATALPAATQPAAAPVSAASLAPQPNQVRYKSGIPYKFNGKQWMPQPVAATQ